MNIEIFNKINKVWEEKPFRLLRDGDVFRIFDNGKRYFNKKDGNNIWIASGYPYKNKEGIYTVSTLY
jgi:hypothetical protein